MKKSIKIIIIILSVIILLLLGIIGVLCIRCEHLEEKLEDSININNKDKYISSSEAIEKAISSLGVDKSQIFDISSELDYKYGCTVYDVDFKYNIYEYTFYINAETGEIVKQFKEID